MSNQSRVCTRCIMDTSAQEIEFDENGLCNYCKQYLLRTERELHQNESGQRALAALVGRIKERGRGNDYDCVIGVSGGVDSTYVAYLVKQYGLRPLALHLDNGWNSELAVANIEKAMKKLDIDLHTHVLDWDEFKDLQLSFLKSSISNVEIATDHAIWALMLRTAARMKVPYFISGSNIVTEAIMPKSWLYESTDSRIINAIHGQFGRVKLRTYPQLSPFNFAYYLFIKGIKWIPILNYVPYVKSEAKQFLVDELGWRDYGGKHYESVFTRFFHAYLLPQKFNVDTRRSYLSALVMSGQITRDQAMTEIAQPPCSEAQMANDVDFVSKKLELTREEFESIMKAPIKTYRDYPNNAHLWERFAKIASLARRRAISVD